MREVGYRDIDNSKKWATAKPRLIRVGDAPESLRFDHIVHEPIAIYCNPHQDWPFSFFRIRP